MVCSYGLITAVVIAEFCPSHTRTGNKDGLQAMQIAFLTDIRRRVGDPILLQSRDLPQTSQTST